MGRMEEKDKCLREKCLERFLSGAELPYEALSSGSHGENKQSGTCTKCVNVADGGAD